MSVDVSLHMHIGSAIKRPPLHAPYGWERRVLMNVTFYENRGLVPAKQLGKLRERLPAKLIR